ncbi:type I restriction enzyme HsdR N-terminal domain-containing protein [Algoriphagus sediminis]|uniref:Type I restriction enzyme HsdR N-terminal domain-containing protein n=1 Tax=Algoriphagus sediminis TaxID=3057113 RepID=A0ABT7Y868_9BACT|nr:type I restriction enzyme HsdR N-terminal domain-containing protein [Algoriphagus sediminis]MDN3202717.1 type I restriction enzyme HsdR N-terminal domain-containing protein [Algoriphagus sediminis]
MDDLSPKLSLPNLNLPEINPRISRSQGQTYIWDAIRGKELVLTPEEWVRQHWISFLIRQKHYPKGLFSLEKGLKYNSLQKRTDVLIYNRNGQPYLLIECKAPQVKITQKTMEQAAIYHKQLQSEFLILSNGLVHISLQWSPEKNSFEQIKEIPKTPK